MNPRSLVPLAVRLADKTEWQGECLIWKGKKTNAGYGLISVKNRMELVHRVAYQLVHGALPYGQSGKGRLVVCHQCDTPLCVRIEHLFIGTDADNLGDMRAKGRSRNANTGKTHCKHGHELTPDNIFYSRGGRSCKSCVLLRRAAYQMTPETREKKRIADAARWERYKAIGPRPLRKRRRLTHCKNGHEFTPENRITTHRGDARCRICKRAYARQYYRDHRKTPQH